MKFFVSGMFVYSEVIEADSFEEAADIFEDTNALVGLADLDGSVVVTEQETGLMQIC